VNAQIAKLGIVVLLIGLLPLGITLGLYGPQFSASPNTSFGVACVGGIQSAQANPQSVKVGGVTYISGYVIQPGGSTCGSATGETVYAFYTFQQCDNLGCITRTETSQGTAGQSQAGSCPSPGSSASLYFCFPMTMPSGVTVTNLAITLSLCTYSNQATCSNIHEENGQVLVTTTGAPPPVYTETVTFFDPNINQGISGVSATASQNGVTVESGVSTSGGILTLPNLQAGPYAINWTPLQESGYTYSAGQSAFAVSSSGSNSISINLVRGSIKNWIYPQFVSQAGKPIQGLPVTIFNGTTKLATQVTNITGQIGIFGFYQRSYTYEYGPIPGYTEQSTPVSFSVSANQNFLGQFKVLYTQQIRISFISNNNQGVSGITFTLTNGTSGQIIGTQISGSNGTVNFYNLSVGGYVVGITTEPSGYGQTPPQNFNVNGLTQAVLVTTLTCTTGNGCIASGGGGGPNINTIGLVQITFTIITIVGGVMTFAGFAIGKGVRRAR